MVDYFTDSANLYIRDSIRLNQSLVDEMLRRGGGFGVTRYFVARHITLDDAVFTDSDVVLVADTVTASAPGRVQITLKHGGPAKAGVVTTVGRVEPPRPVEGEPPHAGAAGHELLILCRTFIAGQGVSHGEQGGQGLRGPYEFRNWCTIHFNPIPEMDPCSAMDPSDLGAELTGGPGGPGLPGAPGGAAGSIRVLCLENKSGSTTGFTGIGGLGGRGGQGGRGGPNGRLHFVDPDDPDGPHGPDGPRGVQPDQQPSVARPIQVVGEAALLAEIAQLTTVIRVGGDVLEHHRVADLWAEFRRRQAGEELRRRDAESAAASATAAQWLQPDDPDGKRVARQVRDHATQHAVERDLDVPADVPLFTAQLNEIPSGPTTTISIWGGLSAAIWRLVPVVDSKPPKLLDPAAMCGTDTDVRALLGTLLAAGEFTAHANRAGERVELAGRSRRTAHLTRKAAHTRLAALLGAPANAGVTIAVPGVGPLLGVPELSALASALFALAPEIAADETSTPTGPSGDGASLLPGDVALLVNRSTRDGGARGHYPARPAELRPTALGIKDQVGNHQAWKAVGQANTTGIAIDLPRIAADLRGALRPPGAPALTDPVRLDIVNGLIELAEATQSWRLADLRLDQAGAAAQAVNTLREAAETARALPATDPAGFYPDLVRTFLARVRAVSDLLEWRWHRLERAFDLYTVGVGPMAIDRAAHADLFDPTLEAELAANPARRPGASPDTPDHPGAVAAARQISRTLERISHSFVDPARRAYDDRGDRTYSSEKDEPFPARRVFCLHASPDPVAGCQVASPHVFAALRSEEQAACWLDVDLSDVQGPHREAKLRGAFIRITYDLDAELGAQPEQRFTVQLRHSGVGRQRQLENGAELVSIALPQPMTIDLVRAEVNGIAQAYWEGEITAAPSGRPNQPTPSPGAVFPAYGRGVAAGYRLDIAEDFTRAAPQRMIKLEVHVNYEARQPKGTANLQGVTMTTALRVGATASALVRLTAPAPAPGVVVKLASSDPTVLAVPGQVVVPAGQLAVTAAVQVLKPTSGFPPTLTAATADGVTRRALAPVPVAEPLTARSAVLGTVDGATYEVAVGRFANPGGGRSAPTVIVTRTPPFFAEEPTDPEPHNAIHAVRSDLTEIGQRQIGVWPRALALDEKRRRIYVVHGQTVSALDAGTLATVATQTIGNNASMLALDPAADLVYVTRYSEGLVYVLRGSDLGVVQVFGDKPTLRGCGGIAMHPDGGRFYLARNFRIAEPTATAVTSVVRRPDGSHVIDRDAPFGPPHLQPHAVAVDGPAGLVFVACQGGGNVHPTLLTLDASTLATVSSVIVPGPGMSVAARPGTGIAYLACYSGLVLVDGRAGSIALTVKAGTLPQAVAVDPVTGTAYLTDRSDRTVTRIDTPDGVTTRPWR